jgi:TPR repeat protein
LGMHWMGVFYHLGFGVSKNVDKAVEYLSKAEKFGNSQSSYQLFVIHSQEEAPHRSATKAYKHLEKALLAGLTFFDVLDQYFKANFEELLPVFIANRAPSNLVDKDNRKEIENLHEAYINEMKNSFSVALAKDRLYIRPAGFL